jgi:large subunit ribosomal protein L23
MINNKNKYFSLKNEIKVLDIIDYPSASEKSKELNTKLSKVVILVSVDATKRQIKSGVEILFGMPVKSINTMMIKGKRKRSNKNHFYQEKDKKKAIVTFKEKNLVKMLEKSAASTDGNTVVEADAPVALEKSNE